MKFGRLPIKLRQKRERERERERESTEENSDEKQERKSFAKNIPESMLFFIDKLAQDYLINTVYYTLTESHQSSRAGTQIKDFGFLYFDFVLSFDPPVPSPVGREKASCCFHSFHSIPFPWRCGGVSLIFCSKYLIQRC